MNSQTSLAVYGTLRPGESNHFVMRNIPGDWIQGVVRGYLYEITWGPAEGYPGLTLATDGHLVPVSVLTSPVLMDHLQTVDRFEGPGYERREAAVLDPAGKTMLGQASVYEALTRTP